MNGARSVPMTDGGPGSRRRHPMRWAVVAAAAVAVFSIAATRGRSTGSDEPRAVAATTSVTMVETAPTAPETTSAPPATVAGDPADHNHLEVTSDTLPPRPADVRRDGSALAGRFVAEWLTYPPGPEPAAALAARLADLVTDNHRQRIEQLSTSGTDQRPGSVAVLGAITSVDAGVYRVTAWQSRYGSVADTAGPAFWDVTLVEDPAGGWRVDGLRRAG